MTERRAGVWYEVPRQELLDHFTARAKYHAERAAKFEAEAREEDLKAQALLEEADNVTERLETKNSSNYNILRDRREDARRKMAEHLASHKRFAFGRDHLPDDASFFVSRHDLNDLELI